MKSGIKKQSKLEGFIVIYANKFKMFYRGKIMKEIFLNFMGEVVSWVKWSFMKDSFYCHYQQSCKNNNKCHCYDNGAPFFTKSE